MYFADIAAFAGLGLIIGSFLNVLVLRHGTGRDLAGRSGCLSCGHRLSWFELMPVVSWIMLRGACRSCGSRISIQYPLVELVTALSFVVIGLSPLPLVLKILALPIAALMIAIAVYDILHTIIPDEWVLAAGGIAFVYAALDTSGARDIIWLLAGGFSMALPLWGLWAFSNGGWMGFGDVKLAFAMGLMTGVHDAFAALFLAFVVGAVVGLAILIPYSAYERMGRLLQRREQRDRALIPSGDGKAVMIAEPGFTMKSEVPFGPFLVLGFSVVWFADMYHISLPFIVLTLV